jgi:hypothetical protein
MPAAFTGATSSGASSYGKDPCTDAIIDSYLLDGAVPADSTVCG